MSERNDDVIGYETPATRKTADLSSPARAKTARYCWIAGAVLVVAQVIAVISQCAVVSVGMRDMVMMGGLMRLGITILVATVFFGLAMWVRSGGVAGVWFVLIMAMLFGMFAFVGLVISISELSILARADSELMATMTLVMLFVSEEILRNGLRVIIFRGRAR